MAKAIDIDVDESPTIRPLLELRERLVDIRPEEPGLEHQRRYLLGREERKEALLVPEGAVSDRGADACLVRLAPGHERSGAVGRRRRRSRDVKHHREHEVHENECDHRVHDDQRSRAVHPGHGRQ